jgi:hypothetical protein
MTRICGDCLYRTTTVLAGLIVTFVFVAYIYDVNRGEPVISVAALLAAAVIWLIGWAGRHVLAEC